ncbi:MAG: murein hydrolase activator EnvC family protein [Candidatus Dormibacteria bacterium]
MSLRAARLAIATAAVLCCLPVGAVSARTPPPAAAPSPTPSPPPRPKCTIPPGTEDDPTEKALYKHCTDELTRIQDQKSRLSGSLALAQGSEQSLRELLVQTAKAIDDNHRTQADLVLKIKALAAQQDHLQQQIRVTRERLQGKKATYSSFLRRSYENQPNIIDAVMDSRGLSDFIRRLSSVSQIRAYGQQLLQQIRAEEKRLHDQSQALHSSQVQADDSQKALLVAQEQLINTEVRESAILVELGQSINDAQHELTNADGQTADLVAKIVAAQVEREDQLIQAANEASWQAAQAYMANNNATFAPSVGHSTKYPFIWSAQKGVLTQGFGPTDFAAEPPGFGAAHFHAGLDIAADSGTPIYAADDGVVVYAGESMLGTHLIGYGRHVIVAHHNGMMTLYGHLDGYTVKVGDQVKQGQLVGIMGSTGNSSGPHLHFELRINNVPTDPTPDLPPHGPNDFHQ